jgi:hypothetical protein
VKITGKRENIVDLLAMPKAEVSNSLCKRRFAVLALRYSSAAVEAVRMWEAFFALHIRIA